MHVRMYMVMLAAIIIINIIVLRWRFPGFAASHTELLQPPKEHYNYEN